MLNLPGSTLYVATRDDRPLAVGAISADGGITLNYVAPAARFTGVSKALLEGLETALRARGHRRVHLRSTMTALRFYRAAGWRETNRGEGITGYPMEKNLG